MLGFNQETIKQPETIYAIAGASLLSGALIFGFELGIAGSLGAILLGAMVAPIFRFVVQFANKIKLIVDHADEVVTKAKSKIEDLDVLKETLTTTVKEANQTLKDVKKNTLPEANKAIKHTSKTVKDLQILVDDITKNTLPAITTVAKDVHGTMEYVNSGAQTASTLMTPVTVSGKLLRKAGTMVGLGQSEKAVEKAADPAPEKAPLPAPKMQTRQSMRQQKKAQPITPAAQKTKKGQPKLKELAKNAQAEVEQAPAPQTGFFSRLKFW